MRDRGLWIAGAVLLLVPLLFYASMVFQGHEPSAPDTAAARAYSHWGIQQERATGHSPDWYPYTFSGMPSYGSFTYTPSSPVNPLARLHRLTGTNRGAWYVVLFFVAGLAGFGFLRRQGFSRLAAVTASLLYSMNPYFLGNIAAGHSTKLQALCLVPLFLLALDLLLDRPTLARTAFLALAGALLAWSNHPQIAYYAALIGGVYAICRLWAERRTHASKSYWGRLALLLLAASAIAVALLAEPYWAVHEYAPWSIRGGGAGAGEGGGVGWEYATAWSFHPKELLALLVPGWFGLEGVTYWGPMPFTQSTHYFGILTFLLAVLGFARRRSPRRWIWAGISLGVLVAGFGRFVPVLYGPMFHLLPLFDRFRVPSMIYGLLPFCLAYLVAGGVDEISRLLATRASDPAEAGAVGKGGAGARRQKRSTRIPAGTAKGFLIAAIAAAAAWLVLGVGARGFASGDGALLRPEERGRLAPEQARTIAAERLGILERSLAQSMLVVILACGVLALAARRGAGGRRPVWAGGVIAALALGDVLLVDRHFYRVGPVAPLRETVPLRGACEFLASRPGPFRILPAGRDLFSSNAFGLLGLESIGGYHPAKLRAYQDLLGAEMITRPAVLSMLNVRYVLTAAPISWDVAPLYEGDGKVYPWPDSLPRAWSVREVAELPDFPRLRERLSADEFDPAQTALIYAGERGARAGRFAPARVTVAAHGDGVLDLMVEAESAAFLVVSEIAFPPGWKARVDGNPTPLARVNHVLQGIEIPAGRHQVELRMSSPARATGTRVSRAAGLAVALLLLSGGLGSRLGRGRGAEPGRSREESR